MTPSLREEFAVIIRAVPLARARTIAMEIERVRAGDWNMIRLHEQAATPASALCWRD